MDDGDDGSIQILAVLADALEDGLPGLVLVAEHQCPRRARGLTAPCACGHADVQLRAALAEQ
eukprot:3705644-Alexandrium_andersonii.AAC.1